MLPTLMACHPKDLPAGTEHPSKPKRHYTSTRESYFPGFHLSIADSSATLYGWDLTTEQDTVFYQADYTVVVNELGQMDLNVIGEGLSFETVLPHTNAPKGFTKDSTNWFLMPHNSIFLEQALGDTLKGCGTKHLYASRCDRFIFVKRQHLETH